MANPLGNPRKGGIKFPGRESRIAARSFLDLIGSMGNAGIGGTNMNSAGVSNTGMGLDALLGGGAGGGMPLLPSAGTDPVLSGLAFGGGGNPLAALMGGGGGDPAALLASLMGGGMGAEMGAPPASDPKTEIERAVVRLLADEKFAMMLIRSKPSVLQDVVKLLATVGVDGGETVG